jgi:hypothetical protein
MALSNRGRRVNDFTNIINLHGSLEKYFGITNENGIEFKTKINIQTLDGFNQFKINLDIIIINNYKIFRKIISL